jgi:hypothetical protein
MAIFLFSVSAIRYGSLGFCRNLKAPLGISNQVEGTTEGSEEAGAGAGIIGP